MGTRRPAEAPAHASGLLIGADVAARLAETEHDAVYVVADPALGALYCSAIGTLGRTAVLIDSGAAFVAGIDAIRRVAA